MSSYDVARYAFARALFDCGAVQVIPAGLTMNLRATTHPKTPGPLHAGDVKYAANCMRHLQIEAFPEFGRLKGTDAVTPVINAGTPFARELAGLCGVQYFEFEEFECGSLRSIAGTNHTIPPGVERVLVVDDSIETGKKAVQTCSFLKEQHVEVVGVIVLIEMMRGGREALAELGYGLSSVFMQKELADFYVNAGILDPLPTDEGGFLPDLALFGPR